MTAISTGGSGFRSIKHSSRFHSNSCLSTSSELYSVNRSRLNTHSSHLNAHRNDSVPVYFNSTTKVGLHNSNVLNLLVAAGAVAVMSKDSDMGSPRSHLSV